MVWAVFVVFVGWLAIGEDPVCCDVHMESVGGTVLCTDQALFSLHARTLLNRMRVVVVHPLVID